MNTALVENARKSAIAAQNEYIKALSEFDAVSNPEYWNKPVQREQDINILEKSFITSDEDIDKTKPFLRVRTTKHIDNCEYATETDTVEDALCENKTRLESEDSEGTKTRSEFTDGKAKSEGKGEKNTSQIDPKRETLVSHIVEELVSTEFEYLKSLYFLLKNFLTPIHSLIEASDERKISKHIMNNIKMIHTFGSHFLDDLARNTSDFDSIGFVFIKHKKLFNRYAKISKHWNRYEKIVQRTIINDTIKQIEVNLKEPLGFSLYIVKPMQRLAKYELFLKQLQHEIEIDDQSICDACTLINEMLNRCNSILAIESIEFNKFSESQCGNFIMRMNNLKHIRKDGHNKSHRHNKQVQNVEMFLFQKVVIIAINIDGDLHFYDGILIANLRKISQVENLKFTLEDFHLYKMFKQTHSIVLEAASNNDKDKCIKAIDELLWGQLKRLKDEVSTQFIDKKQTNFH